MSQAEEYLQGLKNASPLDGREKLFNRKVNNYLSEAARHVYRAKIELLHLKSLTQSGFPGIQKLDKANLKKLDEIIESINHADAENAASYDHFGLKGKKPVEHDMVAVEYVVCDKLEKEFPDLVEFVHLPFTSEDVNNLAYNEMISDAFNNSWLPAFFALTDNLALLSEKYAGTPSIGLTHAQSASPTTFGKRFAYFLHNAMESISPLENLVLDAKMSGAVGNNNAIIASCPNFDFPKYAKEFVESRGFTYTSIANQRNSHVRIVFLLKQIAAVNTVVGDLAENISGYLSLGWLNQKAIESHAGSSVMPHKINPWRFENAEAYAQISSALIYASEQGLCQSRFERDLSDHAWERMYGEMIGYSIVALEYASQGLKDIEVNKEKNLLDLRENPQVLSEAIQIAARIYGEKDAYEQMKKITRGKKTSAEELKQFTLKKVKDPAIKKSLSQLTPETYLGNAQQQAIQTVLAYRDKTMKLKNKTFLKKT